MLVDAEVVVAAAPDPDLTEIGLGSARFPGRACSPVMVQEHIPVSSLSMDCLDRPARDVGRGFASPGVAARDC